MEKIPFFLLDLVELEEKLLKCLILVSTVHRSLQAQLATKLC